MSGAFACAAVWMTACLLTGSSTGDSSHVPQSQRQLDATYRQLLQRYRDGDIEPVLREVASWDPERVEGLRTTDSLEFAGPQFGALGPQASLVETAVALHTRVAVRRAEALTGDAPRQHLELARYLVARLATNRPSATLVRRWYVALATYLAGSVNPAAFLRHANDITRLYASDPDALASLGIGYERVADSPFKPSAMSSVFDAPSTHGGKDAVPAPPAEIERRRWLELAVSYYRTALKNDAGNLTVRLRLGRALVLSGECRAAISELERVEREATTTPDRFLAALCLGRALDRSGQEVAARAAYRRAWSLLPNARSAAFALSEIEQRHGSLAEATRIIERLTGRQPAPRLDEDPWWVLQNDWRPRVDSALDDMDKAIGR